MNRVNTYDKAPDDVAGGTIHTRVVQLTALGLAAAVGLAVYLTSNTARSDRLPVTAAAPAAMDSCRPWISMPCRCAGWIHDRRRTVARIPRFA